MYNMKIHEFIPPAPRSPFKGPGTPKMNISFIWHMWHRNGTGKYGFTCASIIFDIVHNIGCYLHVAQVEQANIYILHMCARARVFLLHYILIIIKNTCSTCASIDIINDSPVPSACSTLFHLCHKG